MIEDEKDFSRWAREGVRRKATANSKEVLCACSGMELRARGQSKQRHEECTPALNQREKGPQSRARFPCGMLTFMGDQSEFLLLPLLPI